MGKVNRRQLFLSTAKGALAAALGAVGFRAAASSAQAQPATTQTQDVTGQPGSPSATTTIPGNQLPPPDPRFEGLIKELAADSRPWWAPRVVPPGSATKS